jgi:hypothetical protein
VNANQKSTAPFARSPGIHLSRSAARPDASTERRRELKQPGRQFDFRRAFASSLLGGQALADGLGSWDWLAVVLMFGLGVLIVFMLWPYYSYRFRFDPDGIAEAICRQR